MNGVKLFNTRSSPALSDYVSPWEFYKPADYYGRASQIAKKYCKDHPEANKDVVYMAASEAAAFYDLGGLKTGAKFSTVVHVKIRAALLEHKRKIAASEPLKDERTEKMITEETKAAMIADRKAGMSYSAIAAKYKRNVNSVTNNLLNWKKAGLLDGASPEKSKKAPEAAPEPVEELPGQIKLEPEPEAAPSTVYGTNSNAISASDFKPNVWDALSAEMSCALCGILGAGTTVIGRSYVEGKAKVKVRTADGKTYEMRVKEVHVHEWEVENFGAFDKNAEIISKYFKDGRVSVSTYDLPHGEAMQLIKNELDAVNSYTVQLFNFIDDGKIGSAELVYVLVAVSRTLRLLKKALKDVDPDFAEKYKKTCEMCDHFISSDAVLVPREKGDKNE